MARERVAVMTHQVTPAVQVVRGPAELCRAGTTGTKILWS